MTKNSGDWEGLQGHDDDPAQFKHKAWVHEGGVAYICIYIYICGNKNSRLHMRCCHARPYTYTLEKMYETDRRRRERDRREVPTRSL